MGSFHSRPGQKAQHLQEKADKYEFQAREAREAAEASRRNIPYEKRKWTPRGTYEASPVGRGGTTQHRAEHGVEIEAPVIGTGFEEQASRVQQPNYRVVELRSVDYEEDPRRHVLREQGQQPRFGRQEHFEQPKPGTPKAQARKMQKSEKAEHYRTDLLHQREVIDRKLNELDARLARDRDAFRNAAERHKRTTIEDAQTMEEYLDKKRRRAELERRERQIHEMQSAYGSIIEKEKRDWYANWPERSELDAARDRLHRIQEEERTLREEYERLSPAVHSLQKSKKPEEDRMTKINQDIQRLETERQKIGKNLQHIRNEEQAKVRRFEAVGMQQKALREEMDRISAETVEKEKRVHEERERAWQLREQQLKPNVPDSSQIEQMKRKLQEDEKLALEKKKKLEEALKAEEQELATRREAIARDVEEQQRLTSEKPVVTADKYVEQYTARKATMQAETATPGKVRPLQQPESSRSTEAQRTATTREASYRSERAVSPPQLQPGQTSQSERQQSGLSTTEKLKSGFQSIKDKVTGQGGEVPDAPPITEKTKSEFARSEAHHPPVQPQTSGTFREQHFTSQPAEPGATVARQQQELTSRRQTERS